MIINPLKRTLYNENVRLQFSSRLLFEANPFSTKISQNMSPIIYANLRFLVVFGWVEVFGRPDSTDKKTSKYFITKSKWALSYMPFGTIRIRIQIYWSTLICITNILSANIFSFLLKSHFATLRPVFLFSQIALNLVLSICSYRRTYIPTYLPTYLHSLGCSMCHSKGKMVARI